MLHDDVEQSIILGLNVWKEKHAFSCISNMTSIKSVLCNLPPQILEFPKDLKDVLHNNLFHIKEIL